MRSALFVHDSYSSSNEPWIVTVTDELKVRGMTAYAPKFPTPIGQDYISWKVLFDGYTQYITPETVLVGAGVGCAFILRYLTEHQAMRVAKTVFVAPFVVPLTNPSEQLLATSFLLPAFDATLLRQQLGVVDVVVSDNDLLVDYSASKQVADMFGAHITSLAGKGHFRAVNGVRLLPEIVDLITAEIPVTPVIQTQSPVTSATPTVAPIPVTATTPTLASLAGQVTTTTTTDVAALQKLLAELSAKGVVIPTGNPSPQQVGVNTSVPVPPAPPTPVVVPETVVSQSVPQPVTVPASEVVPTPTTAASTTVAHSLVADFSSSLINADAREISKTLDDYRKGKEYIGSEKNMRVFRVVALIIGTILLLSAGYFAYRVYFFNETLPTIRNLNIPPLNAVDVEDVTIDRSSTPVAAIENITDGITELDLPKAGDIGVLKFIDQDKDSIPAELAMRLIGGTTPSSIYTKLGSFYAVGAVKDVVGTAPFAVFTLTKPEAEVKPELATWEEWMVNDLVHLFASENHISTETHTLEFQDRVVGNRDVRVLVATRKETINNTIEPSVESVNTVVTPSGVPDTTTPILPLTTTIPADADVIATQATPTPAVVQPATTSETEKNTIDLFKISPVEQTAIRRTRNSLIIAANSPLFQKGILPGDLFALESSDKEDPTESALIEGESLDAAVIAPILGGAPTIVQITDILQQGNKTELGFKPLELSEAIALVGQEVFSNTLSNGASVLATPESTAETGPVDMFGYAIVNSKVLVFAADVDHISTLADSYFEQKKSILDMFNE